MIPKTKYFKNGNWTAVLESHLKGSSITFSLNGMVVENKTFYLSDGYTRKVGRIEAERELKRSHFKEIQTQKK